MKPEQGINFSSTRLTALFLAFVSLIVIGVLSAVYVSTRQSLEREFQSTIDLEIEELQETFRLGGLQEVQESLADQSRESARSGAVYLLADRGRRKLAGNLVAWPASLQTATGVANFYVNSESRPVTARIVPLGPAHWLLVGTETSERTRLLAAFATATAWGIALTTLLVALLAYWHRRRAAQRIVAFADTARSIVRGDLSQRVPLLGSHDEFDTLGGVVNEMIARIEQQNIAIRSAFDSVAHDLRTPLNRLQVRLEQAIIGNDVPASVRALIESSVTDVDRIQRTLATLLQIARAESDGQPTQLEKLDLAQLAQEMAELYAPGLRDAGIELTTRLDTPAFIKGNRQLLAQLLSNLLENVLKYVPVAGHATLTLAAQHDILMLSLSDSGPGIPASERARVLKPFSRLQRDEDRGVPGSGLGLSLVAAIARLHGGRIELTDNEPGLKVICYFPLAT